MAATGCKVFCVGFAKTGTTSLKTVLQQWGYQTQDIVESSKLLDDWARRDYRRLIEMCKNANAFVGVPINLPYSFQALDAAFPGSKFVLTYREDSEAWFRSWSKFIADLVGSADFPPDEARVRTFPVIYPGWVWRMLEVTVGTDGSPFEKQKCIRYFEAHNAAIREYFRFRPESLLELKTGDPTNLERLAQFLEIEPATETMPHITSKMIVDGVRTVWKLDT